jgi:ribosomal subunit interface protein
MRVTITARHCEVSAELRARASEQLDRLERVARRAHQARVLFLMDAGQPVVELQLHTVRGKVNVARAPGADHRTALDRATARLRRQLGREPRAARPRRRTTK